MSGQHTVETSTTNSETKNNEKYIFDIPYNYEPDQRGLGYYLFDNMKKYGNRVAQYIADTGEADTYEQLLIRCIRTAWHLKTRNVTKDDVIITCSYNTKNSTVPFIASLFLNIPVASLDPTLSLIDITHLLKEVKPKILFIESDVLDLIKTSLDSIGISVEIVVFGTSTVHTEFSSFLEQHENEDSFTPTIVDDIRDTAVIFFSSGTTGLPKGIMLNHYALMTQAQLIIDSGNIGPVHFNFATLYWISAVVYLIAGIQIGAAKLLDLKFNPDKIWYLIDKYKVTNIFAAPSVAVAMNRAGRPKGINTSSLRGIVVAGAIISEKHLRQLRDQLPGSFVCQGYGQTEISGFFTWFNLNNLQHINYLKSKPNSVGLLVDGLRAKVVDPDTETLCRPKQQGELRVKTKSIMNGYYKKNSAESFDKDGWIRSGDIVYYDEDGCFYIVDRIKEMLKYKSWHVAPAMLEEILISHPAVAKAAVIGIPHEEDGDLPMAFIVLTQACDEIKEEDIITYIEERVPDRMRLRGGVRFLKDIPMTPSGKIKKKELKTMVLEENLKSIAVNNS